LERSVTANIAPTEPLVHVKCALIGLVVVQVAALSAIAGSDLGDVALRQVHPLAVLACCALTLGLDAAYAIHRGISLAAYKILRSRRLDLAITFLLGLMVGLLLLVNARNVYDVAIAKGAQGWQAEIGVLRGAACRVPTA
jgi:hypothetical protein